MAFVVAMALGAPGGSAQTLGATAVERGAYILAAAGCVECHTEKKGVALAGGRALKTPFGTFYSPNITPDPEHGIGKWKAADFERALREGVGPDGTHYFPAFPYPSFTGMTDQDIADLFAYLKTIPPSSKANKPHDISFPFNIRMLMVGWNALYLKTGPFKPDPKLSPQLNRGTYLVRALGHCGECHTPRNALGALDWDMPLAGNENGPEGGAVPNLTPDKETGIGKWAPIDITYLLENGQKPDGDEVGSGMSAVVRTSTSKLTAADRAAIAAYLKSLPPIHHVVKKATKPQS